MTLALIPPFRLAAPADAPVLAELVNYAGEGLPHYLWRTMAAEGQDPWQIGRERQAKKAAEGQIYVIDEGDGVVAGLTGYAIQ
ncbi:MAG: GNAT family N-acetyltransferase, partial [Pseudomonadota bacterium]|nr:GNAT family N-acetyltransferase [Pseudomonadota bacterium]